MVGELLGNITFRVFAISVLCSILIPIPLSHCKEDQLENVNHILDTILRRIIGVALIIGMFVFTIIGVFWRYILKSPLLWVNEFVLALYVALAFFMSATNVGDHKEVVMDFILGRISEKSRAILEHIYNYLQSSLSLFICYFSFQYMIRIKNLGLTFDTLWGLPWWILYAVAPISFFACSIFLFTRIAKKNIDRRVNSAGGRS